LLRVPRPKKETKGFLGWLGLEPTTNALKGISDIKRFSSEKAFPLGDLTQNKLR